MIYIDAILLIPRYVLVACKKMHIIFFFTWSKYSKSRYKLMNNLLRLKDLIIIDIHLLLWGDNVLSTEVNNCIFSYVQTYIHETNRFNWCSWYILNHLMKLHACHEIYNLFFSLLFIYIFILFHFSMTIVYYLFI